MFRFRCICFFEKITRNFVSTWSGHLYIWRLRHELDLHSCNNFIVHFFKILYQESVLAREITVNMHVSGNMTKNGVFVLWDIRFWEMRSAVQVYLLFFVLIQTCHKSLNSIWIPRKCLKYVRFYQKSSHHLIH